MEKERISLEEFVEIKDGGRFNCSSYIIEYNGNNFRGSVSGKVEDVEHNIWNETGVSSIYHWKGGLKISVEEIKNKLDATVKGVYFCCSCGKPIYPGDKCEGYFAGTYCMDCWNDYLEEEREWDYSHLD